jgi:predicted transcriptional regulator
VRAPNSKVGEHVTNIFNVKISDDMRGWLKSFADVNGCTQSQIVRDAIQKYRTYYDQFEPPSHRQQ